MGKERRQHQERIQRHNGAGSRQQRQAAGSWQHRRTEPGSTYDGSRSMHLDVSAIVFPRDVCGCCAGVSVCVREREREAQLFNLLLFPSCPPFTEVWTQESYVMRLRYSRYASCLTFILHYFYRFPPLDSGLATTELRPRVLPRNPNVELRPVTQDTRALEAAEPCACHLDQPPPPPPLTQNYK